MSHTATCEKNHTPALDGWSRAEDGKIHTSERRAWQIFGALMHDPKHAPAYALNLVAFAGMSYPEFLDLNDIQTLEAS